MENRRGTDGIKNLRGLVQVLGKYRYALIVLLVGAALMLLPSGRKLSETKAVTAPMQAEIPDVAAVQSELAALLSRVDGAGEVAVMLSLDYGPERFFQADEQKTADGERSERSSETVLYHESSAQRLPARVVAARRVLDAVDSHIGDVVGDGDEHRDALVAEHRQRRCSGGEGLGLEGLRLLRRQAECSAEACAKGVLVDLAGAHGSGAARELHIADGKQRVTAVCDDKNTA